MRHIMATPYFAVNKLSLSSHELWTKTEYSAPGISGCVRGLHLLLCVEVPSAGS